MNSGHVTKEVCVHVCTSRSLKCDSVLLGLLTLVVSRNVELALNTLTNYVTTLVS